MLKIDLLVGLPINRELVRTALASMSLVWTRHMHTEREIVVSFGGELSAPGGGLIEIQAGFFPRFNEVGFAVANIFQGLPDAFQDKAMVYTAAHEAMHVVQEARGIQLETAMNGIVAGSPEYHAHPVEIEVNKEAGQVLKGYDPTIPGILAYGKFRVFPPSSVYLDSWRRGRSNGFPYVLIAEDWGPS